MGRRAVWMEERRGPGGEVTGPVWWVLLGQSAECSVSAEAPKSPSGAPRAAQGKRDARERLHHGPTLNESMAGSVFPANGRHHTPPPPPERPSHLLHKTRPHPLPSGQDTPPAFLVAPAPAAIILLVITTAHTLPHNGDATSVNRALEADDAQH